jgi:hypothetical protein
MNIYKLVFGVGILTIVVSLIYGMTTIINPVESSYTSFTGEVVEESKEVIKENEDIEMKIGHDERWMSSTVWGEHKEFVQTVSINPEKNIYTFHVSCVDIETEIVNQAITENGKVIEVKQNMKVFAYDNVCHYADNK